MDNQTGLAILSTVLNDMSYKNSMASQNNSAGIDVQDLHRLLLKGCYYLETQVTYLIPESGN
jgi:hypothetical protein